MNLKKDYFKEIFCYDTGEMKSDNKDQEKVEKL